MTDLNQVWALYKDEANKIGLLDAAIRCGAVLKRAGGEHVGPCPRCGGKDRFGINERKSAWVCRGAGGGHDAIGLVQHAMGLSFADACQFLTGREPPTGGRELTAQEKAEYARAKAEGEAKSRQRAIDEAQNERARRETAALVWSEALEITGTLAERYLSQRVHNLNEAGPLPAVLRYHPSCPLLGARHPALIARVDGADGNPVGIWRTGLTSEGKNLLDEDGKKVKLGLGPCGGGAIRLYEPEHGEIAVCEGLETAFGVRLLSRRPVWSCRTANGLSGLDIPFEVSRIHGYPDGDGWKWQQEAGRWQDPTGIREMEKLRERALADGIDFLMQPQPKPGSDFLDVWNRFAQMEAVA